MHAPLVAAKGLRRVHQRLVIAVRLHRCELRIVCVVMAVPAIAISAQSIHGLVPSKCLAGNVSHGGKSRVN